MKPSSVIASIPLLAGDVAIPFFIPKITVLSYDIKFNHISSRRGGFTRPWWVYPPLVGLPASGGLVPPWWACPPLVAGLPTLHFIFIIRGALKKLHDNP